VIHKIDRSARNYHDWAIISDLADSGIEFHIATESFDFDTYGGRMAADFMAVVAANYVRNLKTEILKGQQGQLKIGLWPWGAPVGYLNNGAAKVKTPDPATAPLVRRAFELYGTGTYSIRTLTTEMRSRGLRSLSGKALYQSNIERLLGNPFYCGILRIQTTGQTFKGAHQPLIPAALFERVKDIKSGRKVKKLTRHNHLYRGLIRCGHCHRSLIGEHQKGHVYYRCHTMGCALKTIRERRMDEAIAANLEYLSLSPEDFATAQLRLPTLLTSEIREQEKVTRKLQAAQVSARLDRLTDLLLDSVIDKDLFQAKKEALLVEQLRLAEEHENADKNTVTESMLQKFLELVTNLAELYKSATKPEKRRIVEWASSNRTATEKGLYFEPSNWLTSTKELLDVLLCADSRNESRRLLDTFPTMLRPLRRITRPDETCD
jgi:site-specific DNA recombinase